MRLRIDGMNNRNGRRHFRGQFEEADTAECRRISEEASAGRVNGPDSAGLPGQPQSYQLSDEGYRSRDDAAKRHPPKEYDRETIQKMAPSTMGGKIFVGRMRYVGTRAPAK